MRVLYVFLSLLILTFSVNGQSITGTVTDDIGIGIPGASITVKGKSVGTATNENGEFSLTDGQVSEGDSLVISHLGFYPETVFVKSESGLNVKMEPRPFNASEVVISASRYDEKMLEAPSAIEKLNAFQLQSSASGDYYKDLNTLKDVHIVGNSLTFNVFNARGFNTSSPFRVVNFIDGMDAQSPGLNFAPGRMLGIPEIDMQNMEVITGPSSALYGSNALQGVLSMNTKDPYLYQGVSAQLKGGSRSYLDAQIRVAKAFGKKERFAVKVAGSYMVANDWIANDAQANSYFPIMTAPQDLNSQVAALDNTGDQRYGDFNAYAANNPTVLPNQTPPGTQFQLPGYNESGLFDGKVSSAKASASVQYKISDRTRVVWSSRFAEASGVYQGNNRAVLKDFILHQHKLEIRDDRFLVRAYTTFEDAGNSYDLVLTGINAGFAGLGGARSSYLSAYVGAIDSLSNGFTTQLSSEQIQTAVAAAEQAATAGYLSADSDAFQSAVDAITQNPDRPNGGKYTDKSNMQHVDAQYNLKLDFLTANIGASWRRFDPRSDGNIFADTLDADGKYTDISYMEYGAFLQVMRGFFNDKLKLHASVRFDKSQNFKLQVSPRGAITFNHKGHYWRAAYQTAFRNPTLNEQYFLLNVGPLIVRGNVSGYDNLYTQSSVDEYLATPPPQRDPAILRPTTLNAVQPERLNTFEFGYKYLYKDKLLVDASFYYNTYKGFIGTVNVVEPNNGSSSDSTGVADVNTRQFVSYSIAANAKENISTLGASASLKYSITKGLMANASYSFARVFDDKISDDLIPGFNTPPHKFNIGLTGRKLFHGLGFAANFYWVDSYVWESPFSDRAARVFGLSETRVPSYHTLDLMVMYELDKIYSTFRVGVSNIYNNKHVEIWGGPEIGAMVYASWLFDLKFN